MPPTLVIYNPVAGRGRVQAQWPLVEEALRQAGLEFDAVATHAPLEAMKLATEAPQKYSAVVSVGGDGTTHEIVNGLMRASGEAETIATGIVPLGNGDDFVKIIPPETPIGSRPPDWRVAVQKIARGQTMLFDVGRIVGDYCRPDLGSGPHYFVNSMDIGFGAQAAQSFTTIPKYLKGMSAYLAAIFKTMIDYPDLHVRLQLDDQPPFDQRTTMTVVMNGRCFANGFWVCPDARADDGLFDLMVSENVGRLTILRLLPKLMKGTHLDEPIVHMHQARRVVIDSHQPLIVETDGEIPYLEAQHLELEILHKRLRVFV